MNLKTSLNDENIKLRYDKFFVFTEKPAIDSYLRKHSKQQQKTTLTLMLTMKETNHMKSFTICIAALTYQIKRLINWWDPLSRQEDFHATSKA